jgi:DNA-binding NtrC family response regulator
VDAPILARVSKAKQDAETAAILNALNGTRWNRKQAATILKIDYKALLYKMKTLGISGDNTKDSTDGDGASKAAAAS